MRTIFTTVSLIFGLSFCCVSADPNWIRPDEGINTNLTLEDGQEASSVSKYYFNSESGKCDEFKWKGWSENENNFDSEAECQIACDPSSIKITKQLKCYEQFAKNGNGLMACMAYFPKWSYDLKTSECKQFVYGGCGGNKNQFDSLDECEVTCNIPHDDEEGPLMLLLRHLN